MKRKAMHRILALATCLCVISGLFMGTGARAAAAEDAPGRHVSVGGQAGSLTAGAAGAAVYTVATLGISDGTAGYVDWAGGGAPPDVAAQLGDLKDGAATLTVRTGEGTPAGDYPFTVRYGDTVSEEAVLAVGERARDKWVQVGEQSGSLKAGTPGAARFPVTTGGIGDGETPSIRWLGGIPDGITVEGGPVSGGAAELTARISKAAVAGEYLFIAAYGGEEANIARLTIEAPKTVQVGNQSAKLSQGAGGTVTYEVSASLIDDRRVGEVRWLPLWPTGVTTAATRVKGGKARSP